MIFAPKTLLGAGSAGKMNTANESAQSQTTITRLPRWLQFSGMVIFAGAAMLSARLIWEQTVWTWERGPQMVGFSLAHGPGAILFIFPLLLLLGETWPGHPGGALDLLEPGLWPTNRSR